MGATRSFAILGTLAVLTLAACTQGQGPTVERTRPVDGFSRIDAGAGVQVQVTIGPAGPLVVRTQENIQDMVTTAVRNGTLRIEAVGNFTVADPVVVEVTVPSLDAVTLSGGAAVEVTGLDTEKIDLSLSGGGRATISGVAQQVTLSAKGGAIASLGNLAAEVVMVDLDGGATAEVAASGSVQGSASGAAKLTISGDASVQVETSGGAEVERG
jgi:hypothetical protein